MKVSAFDLDHTLLSVNSSFHFGRYLFKQKQLSALNMLRCVSAYVRHSYMGMSSMALHRTVCKALLRSIPIDQLNQHVQTFLEVNFSAMLHTPVVLRLEKAQRDGHYVAILSTSPDFLVTPIAQMLGVQVSFATQYTYDALGRIADVHSLVEGSHKASIVNTLMARFGLAKADITAYSDSYRDLELLEAAGTAVGVNPDKRLRRICQKRNWEIL